MPVRGRAQGFSPWRQLQPNASNAADAEVGWFAFFQTRFPHSSTLQLGGKARFASQPFYHKKASRFSTLHNSNAGTRSAEKTKTDKHSLLCQQLGMDFVPIILAASGGMTSGAVPEADSQIFSGRTGIHRDSTLPVE
jgi:hypothetical protein